MSHRQCVDFGNHPVRRVESSEFPAPVTLASLESGRLTRRGKSLPQRFARPSRESRRRKRKSGEVKSRASIVSAPRPVVFVANCAALESFVDLDGASTSKKSSNGWPNGSARFATWIFCWHG